MMQPQPRPRRTLKDALAYAHRRGMVQKAESGPDNLYHFTIVSEGMVSFVRVRYMPRILATIAEIATYFSDAIGRLRRIVQAGAVSRELWIRSRHGTFRFFRLTAAGLVEIDEHGNTTGSRSA